MSIIHNARYIAIEGPPCMGKTSLAHRLTTYLSAYQHTDLLLDPVSDSPLIESFYQNPDNNALSTQLTLLYQRLDHTESLTQRIQQHIVVSDFMVDKSDLFSQFVLSDADHLLWQRLYRTLKPVRPTPSLVLYIYADTEQLLHRMSQSPLTVNRHLSREYVHHITEKYHQFFHDYTAAPLLSVNAGHFDFGHDENAFNLLMAQLSNMRGTREFFNPNF